jgi:polyisoprenoid-binding protein YceI
MTVKRRMWWIAGGLVAVLAAVALIGPFVYSWLSDEPATLVSQRIVNDGVITAAELEGVWRIGDSSIVGYRVEEKIALTDVTAVGRTSDVTGEFTVVNAVLETAEFTVDMATFASDRSQRDGQFRTRIMDVATYPTATFRLTAPVAVPVSTTVATMEPFLATGDLTLRGTTKPVTFEIYAVIADGRLRLTGSTEIVFREWGIPNPSVPEAFVYTGKTGVLEFDLAFDPTD